MKIRFSRFAIYGLIIAIVAAITSAVTACSSAQTTSLGPTAPPAAAATSQTAETTQATPTPSVPSGGLFQRQGVLGTVTSINGDTLTLTTMQGQKATVDISANTAIDKTVTAALTDLQPGEFLTIAGSPDASGVIIATSIQSRQQMQNFSFPTPSTGATFPTPAPGSTFTGRPNRQGNGSGGGNGNGSDNGNGVFARTIGTLDSTDGNTLTLTVLQGGQVKVNVTPQTVIERTVAGAVADIEEGESLTVMGPTADNDDITAESISIRP
jgi:hypothetical protein